MNKLSLLAVLVLIPHLAAARFLEREWSYQQMFAKADLVVVARPIWTKATKERSKLPGFRPRIPVVGVLTGFETSLVLKGDKNVKHFVLHHYRLARNEPSVNGPMLVSFNPNQKFSFLLFLTKQSDGRYAPVTGQTDPAILSVIMLESAAE
jgi:hypothetical protein